jgi:hypothetical protein
MIDLSRYFADPLIRASILERMSDEDLLALSEAVEPVPLSPQELEVALTKLRDRLEPPQRLLDLVAARGGRLLGSSIAALQALVLPASKALDVLLGAFLSRVAPATLGAGAGAGGPSSLALLPREKGAPVLRGTCRTNLRWEPAGQVLGSIHVPAEAFGTVQPWEHGWVMVELRDAGSFMEYCRGTGREAVVIEFVCSAPARGDDVSLPLPSEAVSVTYIQPET